MPTPPRNRSNIKSRTIGVTALIALVFTTGTIAGGVALAKSPDDKNLAKAPVVSVPVDRTPPVSRSNVRKPLPAKPTKAPENPVDAAMKPAAIAAAIKNAKIHRWATDYLILWTRPDNKASKTGVLPVASEVLATGRTMLGRTEIVYQKQSRWVNSSYLSNKKPDQSVKASAGGPSAGGSSAGGHCPGTPDPAGVHQNVRAVHQIVCANFPEITNFITLSGSEDHPLGLAIDIMVSGSRAWQVAEFLKAHASELNIKYIIHAQRIWSVQRSSEGWRPMEDRGSPTANHFDHVHVSTF